MIKKTYKVLITDDDKDIHEVLEMGVKSSLKKFNSSSSQKNELLEKLGKKIIESDVNIEIHHAYQGQEAIDKVSQINMDDSGYDLILMDMLMPPGINGAQTISEITKISKNTKVLFCTAYFHDLENEIINSCATTQKAYLMKKPFDLNMFSQFVQSILSDHEIMCDENNIIAIK